MRFYSRVTMPHGMEQTMKFDCPGERAYFLRETEKRWPGSKAKLWSRPTNKETVPLQEDAGWFQQVFDTV